MRARGALLTGIQILLAGSGVLMTLWIHLPWPISMGLVVIGASSIARRLVKSTGKTADFFLWLAWVASLGMPVGLWLAGNGPFTIDEYEAVISWTVAGLVLPTCFRKEDAVSWWKLLVAAWALLGCLIWLTHAYLRNLPGEFYIGIVCSVAFLVGCKLWFRLRAVAIIASNTLILLLVGLPLLDLVLRPSYHPGSNPFADRKYYSFEEAKKDPNAFARWWEYYSSQCIEFEKQIFKRRPGDVVPYRLIANSRGRLLDSEISINSKGFRGREIVEPKGDCYRIVTLGESTTFGLTIGANDRPWPDLLESMIRDRLKPQRPIQVINAGVPGYTILDNLHRLTTDILPLHPDMVISYHGYNGFNLIYPSLPSVRGKQPTYQSRPVMILARCEYRLKVFLFAYRQRQGAEEKLGRMKADPLEGDYAKAYRQLIEMTRTNGARLVLANFSLAVNKESHSDVVEFYRQGFPHVRRDITANAIHSIILKELEAESPEVFFVDTHPNLDGRHELFLDLMHFTQLGDQQLAENIFRGIRPALERDLKPGLASDLRQTETSADKSTR